MKIKNNKIDWNIDREINEKYTELFWEQKSKLDAEYNIVVSLINSSTKIITETEIEYDEKLRHADGTVGLTFVSADTQTFMNVSCLYQIDRKIVIVTTIFDFRNSIELGDVCDKMYSDLEKKAQSLFAVHEKETEKEGEKQ